MRDGECRFRLRGAMLILLLDLSGSVCMASSAPWLVWDIVPCGAVTVRFYALQPGCASVSCVTSPLASGVSWRGVPAPGVSCGGGCSWCVLGRGCPAPGVSWVGGCSWCVLEGGPAPGVSLEGGPCPWCVLGGRPTPAVSREGFVLPLVSPGGPSLPLVRPGSRNMVCCGRRALWPGAEAVSATVGGCPLSHAGVSQPTWLVMVSCSALSPCFSAVFASQTRVLRSPASIVGSSVFLCHCIHLALYGWTELCG